MITIVTNFDQVISEQLRKIENFDAVKMCAMQATHVCAEWRKRIHQEGLDADGNRTGTYSPGYMKVRTGLYGNRDEYKRGKKKGELKLPEKSAGLYTKGTNIGKSRPRYNRENDTKVVASLTRSMENSMIVIPTEKGAALGYSNNLSYQKSQWVESTYKKKIFDLTDKEAHDVMTIADEYVKEALS